jgi:hypothetical protein
MAAVKVTRLTHMVLIPDPDDSLTVPSQVALIATLLLAHWSLPT